MEKKEYFMSLRKLVPQDMEYYLEEKAAEGYMLKPIGQMGLFYFVFEETKPQKCKYVVDSTSLPKELYLEMLDKKGWEMLGTIANFYICRKTYTDERPENFTDKPSRKKHCSVIGIIFMIVAFLCLFLAAGSIYGIYLENQVGVDTHLVLYIVQTVIQIPFIAYFFMMGRKLLQAK